MSKTCAAIALLPLVLLACSRQAGGPSSSVSPAPSPADLERPLPSPLPDVVARVNGEPVYVWQVLPIAKKAIAKVSLPDRDKKTPGALRRAVAEYVDRELLVQEALARGLKADARNVEWAYDQMRREHPDEADWSEHLADRALDPQSLRAELRIQQTVAALLDQEVHSWPVPEAEARAAYEANPAAFEPDGSATPQPFEAVRGEVEAAVRERKREEIREALISRLRAKARIELLL